MLWTALAESEAELGLAISHAQLQQLRQNVDNIDFEAAANYEKSLRHDVMAHVRAYGDACPEARGIIHWGATSCFVTDNTDLILLRESANLVRGKLLSVIDRLADFAARYHDLPCLAYTHLQPAQPTTVGKRACLWISDLLLDLESIENWLATLKARGSKGTTGTQASFLSLFQGDHEKVRRLEKLVAKKIGFESVFPITGQTYPRKIDCQIIDVLSGIAQSCHKAATDIRLLQSWREIEEPFEEQQVGSSAMAYKRNPMRCERMCGLARFVMSLQSSPAVTASTQWMERTLDDSANRRLVLPQAFLATDAILLLYSNVAGGLVVNKNVVASRLQAELPFMATEDILMQAVAAGGDRQELHEKIRLHSLTAAASVKSGGSNDLLDRLAGDPAFSGMDLQSVTEPSRYVGRAPEQVQEFLSEFVHPIRKQLKEQTYEDDEINV